MTDSPMQDARPATILVVDDIEDTLDVWATAFRRAGFHVLVADSCGAALRTLREEKCVDFVVTDYWLGDGLGEAMLRDAVTSGDLRPGSALICTALRSIERSSYAARVLHKPIRPDELIAAVRELLSVDPSGAARRVLLLCEECNRLFRDPQEMRPATPARAWQNDGPAPSRLSCPECLGRRSAP